ncbi:lysozyme family protein [Melissococcus plutonius]|uniref:lysozyme family protein n=1 Tax=Melissococcus plutonius TaxID=33970 RepID=UPI003C2B90B7
MTKIKKTIKRIIFFIVILLFIFVGYFAFNLYRNIRQVTAFQAQVAKEAKKNDIPQHENLILAIIYTESKGKSIDLMQSSESKHSEQTINSSEESIHQGVHFLAQALKKAEANHCDLWTGVQSYNFGLGYIDYVKLHGRKNSVPLAEHYSKEVLSPLLGNNENKKYHYYKPQAVIYNGGFLYNNGGNMFYADIVKLNQLLIHWLK